MADKKNAGGRKRPARRKNGRALPRYAAIDLGTNNCRLLIAEPWGKTFRVVDSYSQIARLGEGLVETGRLSDASIERALSAAQAIRSKLDSNKVRHVRCVATEACRKAENGHELVRRLKKEARLSFKIIGPKEEARLATIGCHDLMDADAKSVLVIDIGGGSTELSWVNARVARDKGFQGLVERAPIQNWTSLKLGVVTLSELFDHLPEEESFPEMLKHAQEKIHEWAGTPSVRAAMSAKTGHLVGTSGTVTCLAGVYLKLDKYRRDKVDGAWIPRDDGMDVISRLKGLGIEGRAQLPTIGDERAKLMLSGCAILQALWDAFPASRMRVGDRGLREGLLLSMMYGPKQKRGRGKNASPKVAAESKQKEGGRVER